jgi:hypothetical protein
MNLELMTNNNCLVPVIKNKNSILSFINFDNATFAFLYEGYSRKILIDKSDNNVYNLFLKLYIDIENCSFLNDIELENLLKNSFYYQNIFDGQKIKWYNQSRISNKKEFFTIENKEEGILISFNTDKNPDIDFIAMKIMDNPDNNPFYLPFITLYKSLSLLAYKRAIDESLNISRTLK